MNVEPKFETDSEEEEEKETSTPDEPIEERRMHRAYSDVSDPGMSERPIWISLKITGDGTVQDLKEKIAQIESLNMEKSYFSGMTEIAMYNQKVETEAGLV